MNLESAKRSNDEALTIFQNCYGVIKNEELEISMK